MAKIPVLAPPSPPSSGYFCEVKCGADGYPLSFLPPVPKGHRAVVLYWYRSDAEGYNAFYIFNAAQPSRDSYLYDKDLKTVAMEDGGVFIGEGATRPSSATPALLESNRWKPNIHPSSFYQNATLYVAAL